MSAMSAFIEMNASTPPSLSLSYRFGSMMRIHVMITIMALTQEVMSVSASMFQDVANFLSDNGLKYVSIKGRTCCHYRGLLKAIVERQYTFLRFYKSYEYPEERYNYFHVDAELLLMNSIEEISSELLLNVASKKVQRTVIVVQNPSNESQMSYLKQNLQAQNTNSFFYLVINYQSSTRWYQVISLESGYSLNDLEFASNSYHVKEQFDLQGLSIKSISLTWAPYLTIERCNEQGSDCAVNDGYLMDYMNILANRFNFTFTSDKEPNGDWGILPQSGPFNLSGQWDGVMGNVLNGKYDVSISPWDWNLERNNVVQFVLVTKNRKVLVWEPKNADIDFEVFIRPITLDSWLAIVLTTCFALSLIAFISIGIPSIAENSDGRKLMIISIQYFFIFINAYYGGALTMFFSSSIRIPLETLRDTLQAHPDWELKFMAGSEINFVVPALQGDPDYVAYWNYAQSNHEIATFLGIKDGLDELMQDQTIIFLDESMLKGYLMNNPSHHQKLEVYWRSESVSSGLIFPLNSPLVPIFWSGAEIVRERGIQDILIAKWTGKDIDQELASATMVLGSGQMILIFVIMLIFYVVCLFLFMIEVAQSAVVKFRHRESFKSLEKRSRRGQRRFTRM